MIIPAHKSHGGLLRGSMQNMSVKRPPDNRTVHFHHKKSRDSIATLTHRDYLVVAQHRVVEIEHASHVNEDASRWLRWLVTGASFSCLYIQVLLSPSDVKIELRSTVVPHGRSPILQIAPSCLHITLHENSIGEMLESQLLSFVHVLELQANSEYERGLRGTVAGQRKVIRQENRPTTPSWLPTI